MMTDLVTANTVFVYGTLRRGESNHPWLARARYLGSMITRPQYTMIDMGGYPGILSPGRTAIVGEVYQLEENRLPQLDILEEVPELYQREVIETRFGQAWIYVLSDMLRTQMHKAEVHYAKIGHGDWVRYRKTKVLG